MKSKKNVDWNFITKISSWFTTNFRITILFLVGVFVLGILAYTSFLRREGLPAIQFPIVSVRAVYIADDASTVVEDVTKPLEQSILSLDIVEGVDSVTSENGANITVTLNTSVTSQEGRDLIAEEVDSTLSLPDSVEVNYQPINIDKFNSRFDFLIDVASENSSIEELQATAKELAERLTELDIIIDAEAIDIISERPNNRGELVELQTSFNRLGLKQTTDDEQNELRFLPSISVGLIAKGDDVDVVNLSQEVNEKLDTLRNSEEFEEYEIIVTGDFAESIESQIASLEENALGGLIAVVVILMFFINFRASLVAAIFIPTVMAASFFGLYAFGYTLNVISLFSLILVLGLLVDDAIVVVEAIDYEKKKGRKGIDAVRNAIQNIGVADVLGTITTLLVFLPLVFIPGILGEFIVLIPLTVIISLSISLIVALVVIPFLSNLLIPDKSEKEGYKLFRIINYPIHLFGRFIEFLTEATTRWINWYLSGFIKTTLVMVVAFILIGGGSSVASQLDNAIFPPAKDTEAISIAIEYEEDTDLDDAEDKAIEVEAILVSEYGSEIERVTYGTANANIASLDVQLTPIGTRITSTEIVDDLQLKLDEAIDVANIDVNKSGAGGPPEEEYNFSLQIYSDDTQILSDALEEVSTFIENENYEDKQLVTDIITEYVNGDIYKRDGSRYAQIRAITNSEIEIDVIDEITERVNAEFDEDRLEDLGLDSDAIQFDRGVQSDFESSFDSTIVAFILAIMLMYALLVGLYNSFTLPILIFTAIPLSFPLIFPGLLVTENSLGFFVLIGIIGLAGIVVNNTIMLLDFANQLRKEGKNPREAIVSAMEVRFRPLVATSVTTVSGLLPLAISDPFWESLGLTIVFGLISSTTLVILAFPAFYVALETARDSLRSTTDKLLGK